MIYEKIMRRRTIRKYLQKRVPKEILIRCVDAARLSPSAANRQPLKYVIVDDDQIARKTFETLKWAGYLPNYNHREDEKPKAYIVILLDKRIQEDPGHDAGIAAMSISMVAYDEGLGSCIIGSVDRQKLREILNLPGHLDIILVISLGYPAERSVAEEMKNDNVRYWLDDYEVLHVPKRRLEEIVKWNSYE